MSVAGPASDATVGRIIDYIAANGLTAGERLPSIKALASTFGVGPHAVRDGLLHAQTIGLVRVHPRSGAYVQAVDYSRLVGAFGRTLPRALSEADANLLDLLDARRLIEAELVAVAAGRRRMADLVPLRDAVHQMYADVTDYDAYVVQNERFHTEIARIAGNQTLVVVLGQLLGLLRAVLVERQPKTWTDEASAKRRVDNQEHEAILAALVAGDPAAAKAAMLVHLRDTTESLVPPAGRGV